MTRELRVDGPAIFCCAYRELGFHGSNQFEKHGHFMVSTFLLLLIFFVLIGGSLVLFGLFLQLGLSLVKCQESSFKNLKRATLLIFVADVVLRISFLFAPLSENHNSGAIYMALAFLAGLATPVLIIAYVFQLSIFRAGIAWLVTIPQAIAVALIVLFMKPVVGEAYVASANSMSPTILGPHIEFPCSRCDSICFCSPNRSDVRSLRTPSFNSRAICENFHVTVERCSD